MMRGHSRKTIDPRIPVQCRDGAHRVCEEGEVEFRTDRCSRHDTLRRAEHTRPVRTDIKPPKQQQKNNVCIVYGTE